MTLIKEIFEAEKKADAVITVAEAQKEENLAQARQRAVAESAQGKKEAESAADKSVKSALKKLEQRREKILSTYRKRADGLGGADTAKAVKLVLEKVMDAEDL